MNAAVQQYRYESIVPSDFGTNYNKLSTISYYLYIPKPGFTQQALPIELYIEELFHLIQQSMIRSMISYDIIVPFAAFAQDIPWWSLEHSSMPACYKPEPAGTTIQNMFSWYVQYNCSRATTDAVVVRSTWYAYYVSRMNVVELLNTAAAVPPYSEHFEYPCVYLYIREPAERTKVSYCWYSSKMLWWVHAQKAYWAHVIEPLYAQLNKDCVRFLRACSLVFSTPSLFYHSLLCHDDIVRRVALRPPFWPARTIIASYQDFHMWKSIIFSTTGSSVPRRNFPTFRSRRTDISPRLTDVLTETATCYHKRRRRGGGSRPSVDNVVFFPHSSQCSCAESSYPVCYRRLYAV